VGVLYTPVKLNELVEPEYQKNEIPNFGKTHPFSGAPGGSTLGGVIFK